MEDEIAAVVVTRVLAHFPGERNQLIIDAGFTALSQQGFDQLGGNYAKIKVAKLLLVAIFKLHVFTYFFTGPPRIKSGRDDSRNWFRATI